MRLSNGDYCTDNYYQRDVTVVVVVAFFANDI